MTITELYGKKVDLDGVGGGGGEHGRHRRGNGWQVLVRRRRLADGLLPPGQAGGSRNPRGGPDSGPRGHGLLHNALHHVLALVRLATFFALSFVTSQS